MVPTKLHAVARREIVDPHFAHQIARLPVFDVQNSGLDSLVSSRNPAGGGSIGERCRKAGGQSPDENTYDEPMCKMLQSMRIKTSGEYAWRTDLYDAAGDQLGENTRSGAVDSACEFTREILPALEEAAEHPDMTEELAEILSTDTVDVEYEVSTGVNVRE